MEWLESTSEEYREYNAAADGLKLIIRDRGDGYGQRRFECQARSLDGRTWRYTDLVDNLDFAKGWAQRAAIHAAEEIADIRLREAAPDMLAALKAFVEAYEKSLQLEKTDTALRLARLAIEKAEQPQ